MTQEAPEKDTEQSAKQLLGFESRLIHAGTTTDPYTGSVNVPIYQTSTYRQEHIRGDVKWEY